MIQEIFVHEDFEQLNTWLHERKNFFGKMYISLGSKYNQSIVPFHFPPCVKNIRHYTNAVYQMCPLFTHTIEDESKKNLIIVVDRFVGKEDISRNKKLLKNHIDEHPFLEIVLLNVSLKKESIYPLLKICYDFIEEEDILSSNIVLANYINFSHPNEQEYRLEKVIPKEIDNYLLNNYNQKYRNTHYQWFGYLFYYYNYLYKYNSYCQMISLNMMSLQINVFQKLLYTNSLETLDYEKIDAFVSIQQPQLNSIWNIFKKETLCITSF